MMAWSPPTPRTDEWKDYPCILGKSRQSKRVWKRLYGDPGSLFVLHYCNEATCRQPFHLYLGTQKDNISQASREGRLAKSESTRLLMKTTNAGRMTPEIRMLGTMVRAERNRGVPLTEEHKTKLRRPRSEKTKAKMREAWVRRRSGLATTNT